MTTIISHLRAPTSQSFSSFRILSHSNSITVLCRQPTLLLTLLHHFATLSKLCHSRQILLHPHPLDIFCASVKSSSQSSFFFFSIQRVIITTTTTMHHRPLFFPNRSRSLSFFQSRSLSRTFFFSFFLTTFWSCFLVPLLLFQTESWRRSFFVSVFSPFFVFPFFCCTFTMQHMHRE